MTKKNTKAGSRLRAYLAAACLVLAGTAGILSEIRPAPVMGDQAGRIIRKDEKTQDGKVFLIAVFGTDHDSSESDAGMERSDAVKIISFSDGIRIASVQRDLLVWIPAPADDFGKLNHAFWLGGPDLALRTLAMNLDLDIRNYVSFSFRAVEVLAEAAGGIDLYLCAEEAVLLMGEAGGGAGMYHLDQKAVLAYCRLRRIGSDFARMERQDRVMKALLAKLKQMPFAQVLAVIETVMPYVSTDLTAAEVRGLLRYALFYSGGGVKSCRFPENGMADIADEISYGGFSPLYRLADSRQMICRLHEFLSGQEGCTVSRQAERIEERIARTFAHQ